MAANLPHHRQGAKFSAGKRQPERRSPFQAADDGDDDNVVVAPGAGGEERSADQKADEELAESRAEFFLACKNGDMERAKELLSRPGISVNMADPVWRWIEAAMG